MTALGGPAWPALLVGVVTGAATVLGGSVALRLRSALGLFLSFSSGAVIGVALFDLLPEALDVGGAGVAPLRVTAAVGAGFATYLFLDRFPALLAPSRTGRRYLGPGSLAAHSLMDGVGIGVAFQASAGIGWVVAAAVLAHDMLDGANTVALSLAARPSEGWARRWLALDAAMPLVGVALAQAVRIPSAALASLLGVFCGFFLYIGTSELLPRSQAGRPRLLTLAATGAGMGMIYGVVRLAGG